MKPLKFTLAETGVSDEFDLPTGNYGIEIRFAAQTESDPFATVHLHAKEASGNWKTAQDADDGTGIAAQQDDEEVAETVKVACRLVSGPRYRFSVVSTAAVTIIVAP